MLVDILAVAGGAAGGLAPLGPLAAEGAEEGAPFTLNLFWIIVSALNFLVFFYLVAHIVLKPVGRMLADRRERIEQGLRDADAARRDREAAADQRQALLAEARREAGEIVARAQRSAQEARERGVAETRQEIDRLRAQAVAEIEAERQRAIADVRSQVADLALLAAGRLVGETMSGPRERRLVDDFLATVAASGPSGSERSRWP